MLFNFELIQNRAISDSGPVMDWLNSLEVARRAQRSANEQCCSTWSCSSVGRERTFKLTSSVWVAGISDSLRLLRKGSWMAFSDGTLDFLRFFPSATGSRSDSDVGMDSDVLLRDRRPRDGMLE